MVSHVYTTFSEDLKLLRNPATESRCVINICRKFFKRILQLIETQLQLADITVELIFQKRKLLIMCLFLPVSPLLVIYFLFGGIFG